MPICATQSKRLTKSYKKTSGITVVLLVRRKHSNTFRREYLSAYGVKWSALKTASMNDYMHVWSQPGRERFVKFLKLL